MEKKKRLFEPIRRGAPSLPFDFTEALKKMESEYPYPRKVGKNKYEIAPNMYCNEISLKDYFDEFKRALGCKKKKYRFDNIRHTVMNWHPEVRKTITKQMIYMIPYGLFYWSDLEKGLIIKDYFGEVIDDYEDWEKQREEYIENLYKQLKMEKNMRKILTVKELITILLDYNMDAMVYTNANGVPTGISLPNVCYGGDGEGETKKDCKEVIFDIQDEERYNYKR